MKKDLVAVSNTDGITDRDILKFMRLTKAFLRSEPLKLHYLSPSEARRKKEQKAAYRRKQEAKR